MVILNYLKIFFFYNLWSSILEPSVCLNLFKTFFDSYDGTEKSFDDILCLEVPLNVYNSAWNCLNVVLV